MIVEGDIAQLHLAARVVHIFHRDAMIRLCHVHFGTTWRTNDFAIRLACANLLAADFNASVDVVALALVLTALCFRR